MKVMLPVGLSVGPGVYCRCQPSRKGNRHGVELLGRISAERQRGRDNLALQRDFVGSAGGKVMTAQIHGVRIVGAAAGDRNIRHARGFGLW